MLKNPTAPLTVNYKFTNISDQHSTFKAEGISNKNPSYYWRTMSRTAEASLEISFAPSLLYSIEVTNQGSPTLEIVAYNKDSEGNQIERFVCVPKATLISYAQLKITEAQTTLRHIKLREMPNFPKDRLFGFMKVTVSNPFHDTDPRPLGLQSLIITKVEQKPEFDRIKESLRKKDQELTAQLQFLQGKSTPVSDVQNPTPQKSPLSVFKARGTPSHMTSGSKSGSFLDIPQKSPNNPVNRYQHNFINSAFASIKGGGIFTDDDPKQSPNYKFEATKSPNKQPNRFGLSSKDDIKKPVSSGERQSEEEYEAQLMKALEESKKIYEKEQQLREKGTGDIFNALDSQMKTNGEHSVAEDRENISYYYQNLIYGGERMDEEIERSTAIPWEDIESSQNISNKENSNDNQKIIEEESEEVKTLDDYKYTKNTPKKTPEKSQLQTPLSNNTWQQNSPTNYGRDMWALQDKDYSSEFLEMERRGKLVAAIIINIIF